MPLLNHRRLFWNQIKSKSREVIMQVKTQVTALQNKAQKVADKLTEEVIFITKGVQHIQVQAGTAYNFSKSIYRIFTLWLAG
jgi:hypothetical protein